MTKDGKSKPQIPWITRLKERLVYSDLENKWVKLYFDDVRFKDGHISRYNRIVEGSTGRGVTVIPKDENGCIMLVKNYRYPIEKWQWELPRGFAENNSTNLQNAQRELMEETGLESRKISKIGEIYPNSGILSTINEVFLAEELTANNQKTDASDDAISETRFFSKDELVKIVKDGSLSDGITLCALYLAQSKGRI